MGSIGGVLAATALTGCAGGSRDDGLSNVRVGSKPFPEQEILGHLAYLRLQTVEGVQVVDEIGYGNSLANWNATKSGIKDLYWEYTGTAWQRLPPRKQERITDPERLYQLVREDARTQDLRMAPPADFSNEYVLVADRAWSERTNVTTISEFQAHVDEGHTDLGVALNEDFYHRRDGWHGLSDFYGIDADARTALESGTFVITSVGITYELLDGDRVQIASGFDTDPQLDRQSVVKLADDRSYFLPYQPAPTAYAPLVAEYPDVFEVLAPIVSLLDAATMRRLNRQVLIEDRAPSAVARSFLERIGRVT
jgi:osmoprotectant transport system substrate-binding protein